MIVTWRPQTLTLLHLAEAACAVQDVNSLSEDAPDTLVWPAQVKGEIISMPRQNGRAIEITFILRPDISTLRLPAALLAFH